MLPEYENRVTPTVGVITARRAVEVVHPDLALSGHLSGSYTVSSIGPTTVVRIDSSQRERHFVLIEPETGLIQILNDSEVVFERSISFSAQGCFRN
jgi:Icc-related predicted phosphoesterase